MRRNRATQTPDHLAETGHDFRLMDDTEQCRTCCMLARYAELRTARAAREGSR